jgi:hypothetical protein
MLAGIATKTRLVRQMEPTQKGENTDLLDGIWRLFVVTKGAEYLPVERVAVVQRVPLECAFQVQTHEGLGEQHLATAELE